MFDFDFDEDPGIDLTPLIDVIFMLLIFFIMTTTFSKPVLDIILPVSESAVERSERSPELMISVTYDGRIIHNSEEITPEALAGLLESRAGDLLNLFVDEKAPFESFVRVVDVARAKRGDRFVISTQQPAKAGAGPGARLEANNAARL